MGRYGEIWGDIGCDDSKLELEEVVDFLKNPISPHVSPISPLYLPHISPISR